MNALRIAPLDHRPGAYRWYYADFSSDELSAVVIFMLGAVFSPEGLRAARAGRSPLGHCSVNFALYGKRREWTLNEYSFAAATEDALRIGGSRFAYVDGNVHISIDEPRLRGREQLRAEFVLEPTAPSAPEQILKPGTPHAWQVLVPCATARLTVDGKTYSGSAYHDTNHGAELLGERLRGWHWSRTQRDGQTFIDYSPEGAEAIRVTASREAVSVERQPPPEVETRITGWGLRVPERIGELPVQQVLESSPFYARYAGHAGGAHAIGEAADFARFNSPLINWMADYRRRVR